MHGLLKKVHRLNYSRRPWLLTNMCSNCKQPTENCDFSRIIQKFFVNTTNRSDGCVTGYIDSSLKLASFIGELRNCGIIYSVRTSVGADNKLYFSLRTANFSIPYDGVPFRVERTTHYQCAFGNKYFPSKTNSHKVSSDKKVGKRNYHSKKHNCPAKMVVKHLNVFTSYKAESNSWRKKQELLQKLRADTSSESSTPVDRFMVLISESSSHNHPPKRLTTLLPALVKHIQDLSAEGCHSIIKVKQSLHDYVNKMFENSEHKPCHNDESYYPSYQTVYNYVNSFRKKTNLKGQQSGDVAKVNGIECGVDAGHEPESAPSLQNCNVELLPNSTVMLPDSSELLQDSQTIIDVANDQVMLLLSGNEVVSCVESLPVSVLYLQERFCEGNASVVQAVSEEVSVISDLTSVVPVDSHDLTLGVTDLYNALSSNMGCQLANLSQVIIQPEETEPRPTLQDTLSESDAFVQVNLSHPSNNITTVLEDDATIIEDIEASRQAISGSINNIRARLPDLDIQTLKKIQYEIKEIDHLLSSSR